MAAHDLKPGDRITCTSCGAIHEAFAEGAIDNMEDTRCRVCRHSMTHWRQHVGIRLVEDSDEASA